MRVLIGSTEGDLPEDVLKLNESLRDQYRSSARRSAMFQPELLELEREPVLRNIVPSRSLTARLRTDSSSGGDVTLSPEYPLETWVIQAHAYSEQQAAKVSILGRLFAGEAQRVKAGVIHDAKRFSLATTESDRKVEIGVAVRLAVATSSINAKFELTLPNLAADAQLNGSEARVGITVIGYTGPLGDILPAPRKLDVETCSEYMEAFRKIQSVIFGEAGWRYVVPTALSYDETA